MLKTCKICSSSFEISSQDQNYYTKRELPTPNFCPTCRQVKRAYFRNEQNLYHNTCAKTKKSIVSMYRPALNIKVYASNIWWSDEWDPLEYGQDFDFNKSFTEQFSELQKKVPRLNLYSKKSENSEFSNHVDSTKNAYLCIDTGFSEDTLYSKWIISCKDISDCYQLEKSEQSYESLYSVNAHNTKFIYLSDNSTSSDFLYNCKNGKNSLMCFNLRNKEYHIKNKPYTKEEYEKIIQNYDTGSYKNLQKYIEEFEKLKSEAIRKPAEIINSEDCTGDYIYECKDCYDSYGIIRSRDSSYCYDVEDQKDSYDSYESAFECELQYNCHGCNRGKNLISCSVSYDISDSYYCQMCHNSSNLFGCIGLRHKQYCIFNKQYSKEDYFELLNKIKQHMIETEEWGEFFDPSLSFFAYNESAAPEFKNLTKEEAIRFGFNWIDQTREFQKQTYEIPDHIKDVPDAITNEILACKSCNRNYKIISQELQFYRNQNLPIPRKCPQCRYLNRLKSRNPYHQFKRKCQKCQTEISTTYSPQSKEVVYCEPCYLKEIY